ncbi:MAG: phosphoenolpyruvate carboxykinase (ATP), partial [Alphaproteobacteria bacterium]
YGEMLGARIARHDTACWLVNTGWSGGSYGVGNRMKIQYTRSLLHAALDGTLAKAPMRVDPNFGLDVPETCPHVPSGVLNPRNTWADKDAYDQTARELVARFRANFDPFEAYVTDEIKAAAPKAA